MMFITFKNSYRVEIIHRTKPSHPHKTFRILLPPSLSPESRPIDRLVNKKTKERKAEKGNTDK